MQQSNQPPKFVIPFAQNDSAKAVIPATSADDTRASQSLGFPPRTGLPPEAGGVPPQKADMNGVLNQLAGPILWALAGGRFPFDSTFASDPNVGGYPIGANLLAADARGDWLSTANDNLANPDTVGTGWVPGYHYGATALAGQTGGTTTLTPAQAAKRVITVAGTLTSNLVLTVPPWVYGWTFYNNTSGAFSVSVRTAAGSAAAIPQNGAPTPVNCDGTNCSLLAANIAPATSSSQAARLDQVGGRLLGVQRFATVGTSTYTPTAGTAFVVVEVVGAGASGAGTVAALAGQSAVGGGGGGGAFAKARLTSGFSGQTVTIGAGGAAVAGAAGAAGGQSSFGALVVAPGGNGAAQGQSTTTPGYSAPGLGAGAPTFSGAGTQILTAVSGAAGTPGLNFSSAIVISGTGANTPYGSGSSGTGSSGTGQTGSAQQAGGQGSGGGGGYSTAGGSPGTGGGGGGGLVLVWEYA